MVRSGGFEKNIYAKNPFSSASQIKALCPLGKMSA